MSKAYFSVPFVERELRSFWHEYWECKRPSTKALHAYKDGSLRQIEVVRARNRQEAAKMVEVRNPRCVAIEGAVTRIKASRKPG